MAINNNPIEMLKEAMALGLTKEEAMSFVQDCLKSMSKTEPTQTPKTPTGAKAPKKTLTAEEKEVKKKAKTEAWKAEKKAYAEAKWTEEERKAYGAMKQAQREEGKKKHLAYCQTNAFFDGKKVSSAEWHKKYNEFLNK